ncbi:protein translocase subunit SecF [Rhodoplanes elegans]|uniref:Protein-export membrane protein SecF n=2 Tax=Rhodoplanes elegans TaxID=29408 RepID=A0A327K7H6_9BRAD|nr:protein translocase subunit SecF [Rhodoplanes elegans]MBK5962318.1 protein translocase subunit SecF [Rhodoplanes elegans]RAI34357.1 protein translocase subunit SecF [Rhodoplanes elegans]
MKWRRITFPLSGLLSLLAIALFFTVGLNFGIDFRGGTLMEIQAKNGATADLGEIRSKLTALDLGEVQLQRFGAPSDVLIRLAQQPGGDEAQQAAVRKVRDTLGDGYDYRRVEVVGPRVSGELVQNGVLGMLVAIIGILVYLWFRFEWEFAVGATIATLHDVVLTIGFYSVSQIDFDLSSVAAVLTIMGFSVNDTVVIYDRIREMLRRYKKMPLEELLDLAMNSTLSRTAITSTTVILSLLGMFFFGPEAIQSFVQAMLFGAIVGVYSSAFIAAPLLIYFGLRVRAVAEEGEGEAKTRAKART